MHSKPVATDLRGRSSVVSSSRGSSTARPFKPLMACAVFAVTLAGVFAATAAQATTAIGAVAGAAGVSATGAATYSIPINLPPGTNGMQPSLALVYSSQSGEGLVGHGWTVSGLSAITRCPWTIEDGGQTKGVQFVSGGSADKLCLDGQHLLQIPHGQYGGSGLSYSTYINSYSSIVSQGTSGNGPSYFTVTTKDGKVYEYGNTTDSKILAQGQGSTVAVWALDKVKDLNGNYIAYVYGGSTTSTEYWPLTISYTGNGSIAPDHVVKFDYVARPAGTVKASYLHGTLFTNSQLINDIKVKYAGSATLYYNLGYTQDPVNGRNQLHTVQECGSDDTTCLPVTTINWQNAQAGWSQDVDTHLVAYDNNGVHLVDVDGDGVDDLLYAAPASSGSGNSWWVMFGVASGGFTAPVDTLEAAPGSIAVGGGPTYYQYALTADINGDGRTDLIEPLPCPGCIMGLPNSSPGWAVMVSTGQRTRGGIFTTAPNAPPFLGGGSGTQPTFEGSVWAVDFSGKGLSDLVYSDGSAVWLLRNSGATSGGAFAPAQQLYVSNGLTKSVAASLQDASINFDGSGRGGAFAMASVQDPQTLLTDYTLTAFTSNETPQFVQLGTQTSNSNVAPAPMDVNGDGLTGLLWVAPESTSWQIAISTGAGFQTFPSPQSFGFPFDALAADYYGDGRQEAIAQTSGTNSVWETLSVNYTPGSGFSLVDPTIAGPPVPTGYFPGSLRVGRIEAGGHDDLVYAIVNSQHNGYTWHYALHKGAGTAFDVVTSIADGFGNTCTFQYGSLASGAPLYTKGNSAQYPIRDIQPAMQVVTSYTETDGVGGSNTLSYTYSGAQTDLTGKGFLGFAGRTVKNAFRNTTETVSYDQTFPWTGMVLSDQVKRNDGAFIGDTENATPDAVVTNLPFGTAYLPFFDTSITTAYNFNGSSQAVSQKTTTLAQADFDQYGDYTGQQTAQNGQQATVVEGIASYAAGTSDQFATNSVTQYAPANLSTNCLALPQTITITHAAASSTLTRASTGLAVDTVHCRVDSQQATGGADTGVTTTYTFDNDTSPPINTGGPYGNLVETQVSGPGITSAPRTIVYSYAGGNGEFPTTTTYTVSPTNLVTQTVWNYGFGVKSKDIDANNQSTTYGYDLFGRLASITRPDGTQTQYNYVSCSGLTGQFACPSVGAYEVTTVQFPNDTTSPSITTGFTAYDKKGRPVRSGTMLLGGIMSLVDTRYDSMGHVICTTRPYLSSLDPCGSDSQSTFQTQYAYDDSFDRLTGITQPVDATDTDPTAYRDSTMISYNHAAGSGIAVTSTRTASGVTHASTKYMDVMGETTQMVDANGGATIYGYDAFGDLTKTTDAGSNVTSLTYDGLGHKTAMTDPDMGSWSYTVDALGEITCQIDAKGQYIVMKYDGIGRVSSKLETTLTAGGCSASGTTSTWTYDLPGALGLPASVSATDGSFQRAYTYNTLEQPTDVTTTVGGTPYALTTATDSFRGGHTLTSPVPVTPLTHTAPGPNPTATPGTVVQNQSTTLTGSGSTDPNGLPLAYAWSQIAGPTGGQGQFTNPDEMQSGFSSATPGNYTVQLEVSDADSAGATASVSVTVQPVAPVAPTALSPNYNTGTVQVKWDNVTGAGSYYLYESTNGTTFAQLPAPISAAQGQTTATPVTGLTNGTYYFKVVACGNGVCGAQGPSSSAIIVLFSPATPTGLGFSQPTVSTTGSYTLNWNGSATATSYKVYLSNNSLQCTTSATNCPFSGKGNGTYTYYVVAINAAGPSSGSAQASKTVLLPPGAPGASVPNPQSVVQQAPFTLTWTAATSGVVTFYIINGGTTHYTGLSASLTAPRTIGSGYHYPVQACNTANGANNCGPSGGSVPLNVTSADGCPPQPQTCNLVLPEGRVALREIPQVVTPGDGPEPVLALSDIPASVLPALTLPAAPAAGSSVLMTLAGARQELFAAQARQPGEAVMQAEVARRAREKLPSLSPPAPIADLVAWNARQAEHKRQDFNGPTFAPPAYIAYGGAKIAPATSTPYRFAVNYQYDPSSGALIAAQNAQTGFTYWQASTSAGGVAPVDSFGHLLAYTDGNNVSTVTAYDQATGHIVGISSGIGLSSSVQQLTYTWDGFGNLQQRCDANKGLTETFTYNGYNTVDNLNRLSTSNVTTGGTPNTCEQGTTPGAGITVSYDAIGNIQNLTNSGNPGVGGTYAYDPAHPHAVSTVGNITTGANAYDDNGNLVCRFGVWDPNTSTCAGGTQIIWNTDNLPTCIDKSDNNCASGGSNYSSFSYGPDNQRYSQTAADSLGNTTSTTYIGSLFEVVTTGSTTQYRHSIMAGSSSVAVHTIDQSGNAQTSYIHSDHLGSSDILTADDGSIAVDPVTNEQQIMSFDAFGLRRDPTNWSYDLTPAQIGGLKAKTDRGYTAQEQLDNVGLVHMNGRVYDPGIGRFVSADPIVPGDRYAYLGDNPLNDTDPTGYFSLGDIVPTPSNPLGPLNPSSPANPITGPINVIGQAGNAAGSVISTIGDVSRTIAEDNLKLVDAGLDMQRDFTSANIAFAKHWTHESIEFAANPAMNIEYSVPVIGNWFNVRMSHSPRMQEIGGYVAQIASDFWGQEINGGYAAYLAALHGNDDSQSLLEIGGRTTVEDWLTSEATQIGFAKAGFPSDTPSFSLNYLGKDFFLTYVWDNRIRLGHVIRNHWPVVVDVAKAISIIMKPQPIPGIAD